MSKARGLLGIGILLSLIVIISSSLKGDTKAKSGVTGNAPSTVQAPLPVATPVAALAEEPEDARFKAPGVLAYQSLVGDSYFALQLQPNLPKQSARPRDYLIMVSTSATMAGPGWTASLQILDALTKIEKLQDHDRVSIWSVNDPKATKCLTKEFCSPREETKDKVTLKNAVTTFRTKEVPLGAANLKNALEQAIPTFGDLADRQRIIIYMGDGASVESPLTQEDRTKLVREMVRRKIAFYPIPLGMRLEPVNLHTLATGTGGQVLRTRITEEKLEDALVRYEAAFATPILYGARLDKISTEVAEMYPQELPPLRSDTPTLVVGKAKALGAEFSATIVGTPASNKDEISVAITEPVKAADLDNYFLVGLLEQWRNAKQEPAMLRANRALTFAYQQTQLQHQELTLIAQVALEQQDFEAAGRLYQQVRQLSPHDNEAAAGIRIVDRLKKGELTVDKLRLQMDKARGAGVDRIQAVKGGKAQFTRVDIAQLEKQEVLPAPRLAPVEREDLLQGHRDRIAIEEQRMNQLVEDTIRQARRELNSNPDEVLNALRTTLNRVSDHPDLSERLRGTLRSRLETALRDGFSQARLLALDREAKQNVQSVIAHQITRSTERQTFEQRTEAQYNVFRSLMNQARMDEMMKQAVTMGLYQIAQDAREKGQPVPQVTQAAYDITMAGYQVQKNSELKRLREERFLSLMLSVEKSAVPFSDEPGIYFPPLATWKAITKLRKEKYEVSSLPDDDAGRREANSTNNLLQELIDTKDFSTPMSLKDALSLIYEKLAVKGKDLPIIIDVPAFKEASPEVKDPYDTMVSLPAVPSKMSIRMALQSMLGKVEVPDGAATYIIRRNFIEVTTEERAIKDKVLRVYPVGDLVMPISQSGGMMMGGMGMGGGGMGMMGGQMMGGGMMGGQMMGGGGMRGGMGMGGMGMGGMGGMGMGGMGGMGMGGMGGMVGMGGMGMGGMGMGGMGGMGMGGMGMGGMGGMMGMGGGMGMRGGMGGGMMGMGGGMMGMGGGGMMGMGGGMGGMGMMGMGGGMMGGMGMMGMAGGSFSGGMNGSLGMMGATQAMGLIQLVKSVVAPGNWWSPPQQQPFAPMVGGGVGFVGMGGAGMMGIVGGGPQPAPVAEGGNGDIQTSNTIDFFPSALALIVRSPSRVHTSNFSGALSSKSARKEAVSLDAQRNKVAMNQRDPKLKVAGNQAGEDLKKVEVAQVAKDPQVAKAIEDLDATKIWEEALSKDGASPGLVIATADFLFEAGKFKHAAEFLKANLRHGILVRPWVYEALAVALEASGGDQDEVRRARLSAVALDPQDSQGFLQAARTLADQKDYERALAFCRQAAQLEPNLPQVYDEALAFAELGKDSQAMSWAAGKLLSQDWPVENDLYHTKARHRLEALTKSLKSENRSGDAESLQAAVAKLNRRDLQIKLSWDNGSAPSEVELQIKEPSASVCSLEQKQTPGGGTMFGSNLSEKKLSVSYTAAVAFSGEYEIKVRRAWGQPLGGRAQLTIIENDGTPQKSMRMEVVMLDQPTTLKVQLKEGRRTELAIVSPASTIRHQAEAEETKSGQSAISKLRNIANPDYAESTGPRGGVSSFASSAESRYPRRPQPMATVDQGAISGWGGNGITTQLRMSADQRDVSLALQPVFQTVDQNRPAVNLSFIPGGAK